MPPAPPVRKYGAPPIPDATVSAVWAPRWGWLAAAALIVPLVVFLQQYTLSLHAVTLDHAPKQKIESEEVDEPGIGPLVLQCKLAVSSVSGAERDETDPGEFKSEMEELDSLAVSRIDRLRVAIVAAELLGKDAAIERLTKLKDEATPNSDLAREADWVIKLYREGPDKIPDEARASLIDRHGWFGRLALSYGRPLWDLSRRQIVRGGGGGIIAIMIVLGLLILVAFVGGLVALGILAKRYRAGDLESHFDDPVSEEVGADRIYLETFVIFAGGFLFFLGMHLVTFGMAAEGTVGALVFLETLTWLLVCVLFWPKIRGVPWSQFARDVGLHRGQGVGKEIMCGVIGYAAGLPFLLIVGKAIGIVQEAIGESGGKADPKGYPLFEPPPQNSWAMVWVMVLSMVVWAPFLEETMFRGALFRYLHPRLRVWGTVLATAAVFGFIHPYTTSGLVSVASMGVVFGLIRQWRGSLIASMTAHALHNGAIALVTVLMISAIS